MSRRAGAAYFAVAAETIPLSAWRSSAVTTAVVALVAVGLGSAVAFAPLPTLLGLCGLVLSVVLLFAMATLPLWQKLAAATLAGLVILGYGFANWALLPGLPISVGHVLLLASLTLAIRGRGHMLRAFLKEPAVIWWLLLVGLSVTHLVLDIPRYGIVAIRDASFVLEGLFLLLGFLWSKPASRAPSICAVLAVIFLLNAVYALTFPIAQTLQAVSPVSGLFREVPLLAESYSSIFLVAGSLYYFLVAGHVVRWPRSLIVGLAILQIGWDFVFQDRSMYVGIVVVLTLLVFLRGARFGGRIAVAIFASLALFFLVIGVSGIALQGRVGEVRSEFLSQHVRSLFFDPNAPGEGSLEWRLGLLRQLWSRFTASSAVVLIGEGFGDPLIDLKNAGKVAIRQPHDTHVTVLLRLGTLGFAIWLAMHWRMVLSLVRFLRDAQQESFSHDLALWFLLFYVLAMLLTTFQPWMEFSHGAIPFYILMGLTLGMSQEARASFRERLARG